MNNRIILSILLLLVAGSMHAAIIGNPYEEEIIEDEYSFVFVEEISVYGETPADETLKEIRENNPFFAESESSVFFVNDAITDPGPPPLGPPLAPVPAGMFVFVLLALVYALYVTGKYYKQKRFSKRG